MFNIKKKKNPRTQHKRREAYKPAKEKSANEPKTKTFQFPLFYSATSRSWGQFAEADTGSFKDRRRYCNSNDERCQ